MYKDPCIHKDPCKKINFSEFLGANCLRDLQKQQMFLGKGVEIFNKFTGETPIPKRDFKATLLKPRFGMGFLL